MAAKSIEGLQQTTDFLFSSTSISSLRSIENELFAFDFQFSFSVWKLISCDPHFNCHLAIIMQLLSVWTFRKSPVKSGDVFYWSPASCSEGNHLSLTWKLMASPCLTVDVTEWPIMFNLPHVSMNQKAANRQNKEAYSRIKYTTSWGVSLANSGSKRLQSWGIECKWENLFTKLD